jgi:hypothetical protein
MDDAETVSESNVPARSAAGLLQPEGPANEAESVAETAGKTVENATILKRGSPEANRPPSLGAVRRNPIFCTAGERALFREKSLSTRRCQNDAKPL